MENEHEKHLRNLPFWQMVIVKSGYGRKSVRGNEDEATCCGFFVGMLIPSLKTIAISITSLFYMIN